MSLRVALLGAAALLVLGLGVYLFHEVHTSPAAAEVSAPTKREAKADPTPDPEDTESTTPTRSVKVPAGTPDRATRKQEAARDPELAVAPSQDTHGDPVSEEKFERVMSEANKAYDRGDFDEAKETAKRVLAKQPGNIRMLRILVSSSCIDGDTAEAQKRYLELPASDRAQMRTRCDRYGVTFTEK